jgi:hypothetical protein
MRRVLGAAKKFGGGPGWLQVVRVCKRNRTLCAAFGDWERGDFDTCVMNECTLADSER